MNQTLTAAAVENSDKQSLIEHLNDTRRGGYLYIHGYTSKTTGEIANHWVQGACLYGNMVKRSIKILEGDAFLTKLSSEGLKVTRGAWLNDAGESNPTARKSKVYHTHKTITKLYALDNMDDAEKVVEAMASILDGLVNPKKVDQGFTQEAKGAYSKEGEAPTVLYFRDCMAVHKHVTTQGEYKKKASKEENAIKAAIKKLLPVGRYTSFKLDNNFEYITVGGLSVIQGDLSEWELALVETEALHDVETVKVGEAIADSILADSGL